MENLKWLLYAGIALGFPATYGVSLQASGDPAIAVALTFFYGVVVAIAGLVQGVWLELSKRLIPHLANEIEKSAVARLRRYRLRYEEDLTYQHRIFDIKGLTVQGPHALELEKVFVELRLASHVLRNTGNELVKIPPELERGRHSIWEIVSKVPNLAVIGIPGSGKTTLLKYVALVLANSKLRKRERVPHHLPILLFLRDHAAAIKQSHDEGKALYLPDLISEQVARRKPELKPPTGWFALKLNKTGCIVMLDGLDEVADPQTRKIVAKWVEAQMTAYGGNHFILTSRPGGYVENPLAGVNVMEVQGFTVKQQEAFVHNWYLTTERAAHQHIGLDRGVDDTARQGATELLTKIRATPDLEQLAVNPLLLTMIATVHKFRSTLPGRRVELYAEMCEAFLGKMRQARGVEDNLTPTQKIYALQALAYHMMQVRPGKREGTRDITIAEAVPVLAPLLTEIGYSDTPQVFLKQIEDGSSILIQREAGVYSFSHKTFQEYLTARYCKENQKAVELIRHIPYDWWHEAIRLYCALEDATPIIQACLNKYSELPSAIALAFRCAEESLRVNEGIKQQLKELLEIGVERGKI